MALWFYQAKNNAQKKQIRDEWAKEEFSFVLTDKTYSESYTKIDETMGEFHTLGSLVREYGGWEWPPAVVGAKLHFLKASRMGGKWVSVDSWSNLTMVLRLKPIFKEKMEEKWARFTKFHNEKHLAVNHVDTALEGTEGEEPKTGAEDVTEKAKADAKAKAKAKAKGRANKTPKSPSGKADNAEGGNGAGGGTDNEAGADEVLAKRKKEKLAELVKQSTKIKNQYKNSTAEASTLMKAFKEDPQYAWAKDNHQADEALGKAMNIELSNFEMEFITQPWQSMQKRHNMDELTTGLEGLQAKQTQVDVLAKLVSKLIRMHTSSIEMEPLR